MMRFMYRAMAMMAMMATVAGAQAAPYLVKDVDPGFDTTANSYPDRYANLNGVILFAAATAATGRELFKTDGTQAGTVMVKDILPGNSSSNPTGLVVMNGAVYFVIQYPAPQLWKSDGTAEGTVMIAELPANPAKLAATGSKLFFSATEEGSTYPELWVSDGTAAGTHVLDINTYNGTNPGNFYAVGDRMYFSGYNVFGGTEFFISDGTLAGTTMMDLIPGSTSSSPNGFVTVGSDIYFAAMGMGLGETLWRTDGTTGGTVQLNTTLASVGDIIPFNGKVFFTASTQSNYTEFELWVSDGTTGGTVLFKDLETDDSSDPRAKFVIGSTMYFVTSSTTHGARLWKSDGTPAGTTVLGQISSATDGYFPRNIGGKLVLICANEAASQIWTSDGTPAGTSKLMDVSMTSSKTDVVAPDVVGGRVYFSADDATNGNEPWVTDGTAAGTHLLKDLNGTPNGVSLAMTAARGRAFFAWDDSVHGAELWSSDGTEAGTHLVKDINTGTTGSTPVSIVSFMNKAFFIADDGVHGKELWSSDGTAAGTTMVSDLEPGAVGAFKTNPFDWCVVAGNKLYFKATTTANGNGLYCTDGSTVTFLAAVTPYVHIAYPPGRYMCDWNGTLVFTGNDATYGLELWSSDGTPAGTHIVKDLTPGSGGNLAMYYPTSAGDRFYFMYPTEACWLYVSDGTAEGTIGIHQFPLDPMRYTIYRITQIGALGSRAVVRFQGPTTQLWASDGTSETTLLVNDGASASLLAPLYGQMYLSGTEDINGTELWRTDGTAGATGLFADINPGSGNSNPANPLAFDGRLYFSASDGTHGNELWSTDGTPGGTALMADVNAGSFDAFPSNLTAAARTLFFLANDSVHGRELWAVPMDERAAETIDVAAGDTAPVASVTARMAADFSSNSAPGRLSMAYYDAMAPGRTSDVAGYWIVSGLNESTFGVVLTFNYDPAAVAAAGLSEANLRLIRSMDGGRTWSEVASVVDAGANTIRTASAQSSLGMYAISAADRVPGMEIWVNFYWSGFEAGTAFEPFNSLLEGAAAVTSGGRVRINAGTTAERPRITKPMRIESVGGTVRIGRN